MPRTSRYPFRADVRGKLVAAASARTTINYLELGVGRAMVGRYLVRLALEEAAAGRPPLTAVVVRRDVGRPGDGFLEAMRQVGFADPTDVDERSVWERALRDVWAYWAPKLSDDLERTA